MKIKYSFLLFVLFFLLGCNKARLPEGFKLPTTPPDPAAMQPAYGPNDPAPPSP